MLLLEMMNCNCSKGILKKQLEELSKLLKGAAVGGDEGGLRCRVGFLYPAGWIDWKSGHP
jgi:hypothetical protein